MHTYRTVVTPEQVDASLAHARTAAPSDLARPAAAGDAQVAGAHLSFDAVLRRVSEAWMALLAGLGCFHGGFVLRRLTCDHLREVGPGPLSVDVVVLRLGRTSFRLGLEVHQHGALAAQVEAVLVVFDHSAGSTRPLSDEQRDALTRHLGQSTAEREG